LAAHAFRFLNSAPPRTTASNVASSGCG